MATKGKGLNQVKTCSKELAELIGIKKCSMGQAVKKVWEYIKKKKLNEGRIINLDDKMKAVFGKYAGKTITIRKQKVKANKNQITMFDVGKGCNDNLN